MSILSFAETTGLITFSTTQPIANRISLARTAHTTSGERKSALTSRVSWHKRHNREIISASDGVCRCTCGGCLAEGIRPQDEDGCNKHEWTRTGLFDEWTRARRHGERIAQSSHECHAIRRRWNGCPQQSWGRDQLGMEGARAFICFFFLLCCLHSSAPSPAFSREGTGRDSRVIKASSSGPYIPPRSLLSHVLAFQYHAVMSRVHVTLVEEPRRCRVRLE